MAVTSGFFNSINHDRLYDAEQLSSIFDGVILDGVYENIGDAFNVTSSGDGNTVLIGTGRAWFNHTWILNDSKYAVTLDPSVEAFSRIDAIVIDIDKRTEQRTNSIKVLKGVYANSPSKPSMIHEKLHDQYPIAYINIDKGSTSVDNSKITRAVGTSECPIVTGVLEVINDDAYWQQLNSNFMTWWDGIKESLSESDVANIIVRLTDLENKVNGLSGDKPTLKSVTPLLLSTTYTGEQNNFRTLASSIVRTYFTNFGTMVHLALNVPRPDVYGTGDYSTDASDDKGDVVILLSSDGIELDRKVIRKTEINKFTHTTYGTSTTKSYSGIIRVRETGNPFAVVIGAMDSITYPTTTNTSSGSHAVTTLKDFTFAYWVITVGADNIINLTKNRYYTYSTDGGFSTGDATSFTSDGDSVCVSSTLSYDENGFVGAVQFFPLTHLMFSSMYYDGMAYGFQMSDDLVMLNEIKHSSDDSGGVPSAMHDYNTAVYNKNTKSYRFNMFSVGYPTAQDRGYVCNFHNKTMSSADNHGFGKFANYKSDVIFSHSPDFKILTNAIIECDDINKPTVIKNDILLSGKTLTLGDTIKDIDNSVLQFDGHTIKKYPFGSWKSTEVEASYGDFAIIFDDRIIITYDVGQTDGHNNIVSVSIGEIFGKSAAMYGISPFRYGSDDDDQFDMYNNFLYERNYYRGDGYYLIKNVYRGYSWKHFSHIINTGSRYNNTITNVFRIDLEE